MGYESKLYIVEKGIRTFKNYKNEEIDAGEIINGKKMYYAQLISMFDLCKCYDVSDIMRTYPNTDSFIYKDDGNTIMIEDCYGENLKEIPLIDAIEIIESALEKDDYRRYSPCLVCLKMLYEQRENWREIVVLHYGY